MTNESGAVTRVLSDITERIPSMENLPVSSSLFSGLSINWIIFSGIFNIIGLVYFIYGKKNGQFFKLLCGITLCIYPIFIKNIFMIIILGIGLSLLPFMIKE
ncbi:hypothetical protein ACFL2K_03845 [Candidatus Margulisiibacteriota bacterium]